jgi:hypothetical protein
LTRFIVVQRKNLLREREAVLHAKTVHAIEKREIIPQERDLPKAAGAMRGATLQEGVLLKAISGMTDQGLQRGKLVTRGDQDPPGDPTGEILGPHQEGTKGNILGADLDLLQENRRNLSEKSTHISRSAKKCSMKMKRKSSGMASNGSPKPRPRSKMSSTSLNREMSL